MFEGTKQPSPTTMILFKVTNYKRQSAHVLTANFYNDVELFLEQYQGSPVKRVDQINAEVIQ